MKLRCLHPFTATALLLPIFARGSAFVVVGAMHLPGEDGLLRLLELQGFNVIRLH